MRGLGGFDGSCGYRGHCHGVLEPPNLTPLFFLDAISRAGGWELIFDMMDHLFGVKGGHSGVAMHLGHYVGNAESEIERLRGKSVTKGFFSNENFRAFIQSGVALWSQSLPAGARVRCCDLSVIGSDGTPIGIPLQQVLSVPPVWKPPDGEFSFRDEGHHRQTLCEREGAVCVRESVRAREWGAKEAQQYSLSCSGPPVGIPQFWSKATQRCGIPEQECAKKSAEARAFLEEVTAKKADVIDLRQAFPRHKEFMPPQVAKEVERWLAMDNKGPEWRHLTLILRCLSKVESVTCLIPREAAEVLIVEADDFLGTDAGRFAAVWGQVRKKLRNQRLGPEFTAVINCQISQRGVPQKSTAELLHYLGGCHGFVRVVSRACAGCVTGLREWCHGFARVASRVVSRVVSWVCAGGVTGSREFVFLSCL